MHMGVYYTEKLSAYRLLQCYEIATPRIKQYLDAEIRFVISKIPHNSLILELGCGYGRTMRKVSQLASWVVGNDISRESLELAKSYLEDCQVHTVCLMDASRMAFHSAVFDVVLCIQNGISAFGVNKKRLITESVRVAREKGMILFSSYSSKIWQDRLDWFRKQEEHGLIGEIDEEKTGNGTIICKDGFRATTVNDEEFIELFTELGLSVSIVEVDESSIFCKVIKK
jgi:2-polyprenyl-6-hydroxyphenyl methylase/3-demethylubiquinone-9 3-methyltransferase